MKRQRPNAETAVSRCKFCGCTEQKACQIPITFIGEGDRPVIAGPDAEICGFVSCDWLLKDVCTAPSCVEKAYFEARALAVTITESLLAQEALLIA